MDLKFLKWYLTRSSLMRWVVLRAFMLVLALIVVSLMRMPPEFWVLKPILSNIVDKCPLELQLNSNPEFNLTGSMRSFSTAAPPFFGHSPLLCGGSENLTKAVFKELMEKNLLQSKARTLCVGPKSASAVLALRHLGFFEALGVERHPYFSLFKRRFVYELDFKDNSFDFVFSDDLDRLSVPALLVLEMERVLRPGGTGAILVGGRGLYSDRLVRSATNIASFLKSSDVVHACAVGSFTLVIFKKRLEGFASFEHFQLPANCPSVENNKPYMKYIEPIVGEIPGRAGPGLSYLPAFMNISSRSKLVYINVGAGEHAKSSVAKMSKSYCGDRHAAFEVFIIDHRTSVLSSYMMNPGINFVYDPTLTGEIAAPDISSDDEFLSAPTDDEGFDFIRWFDETVFHGDFVVLMMKAKLMELKILVELFETGKICHVDELFLHCSDDADCTGTVCGDCLNLLKSLRKSGVYAHQWLGD
ncbi:hypothetical protein OROGR_022029 [Orobanche gracilis]